MSALAAPLRLPMHHRSASHARDSRRSGNYAPASLSRSHAAPLLSRTSRSRSANPPPLDQQTEDAAPAANRETPAFLSRSGAERQPEISGTRQSSHRARR